MCKWMWICLAACSGAMASVDTALPASGTAASADAALDACTLSSTDQAWLDASLAALAFTAGSITGMDSIDPVPALFFDRDCIAIGADMLGHAGTSAWTYKPHEGNIQLPDGNQMPAAVTAFTGSGDRGPFFVMSTPSIWAAAGVDGGALGLPTLMTAVLLHESIHVAQFPTYGEAVTRLIETHALPDSFNDDTVQVTFSDDEDFAASVDREIELLFAAAAAPDVAEARLLAREALTLLQARQRRWFVADNAYLGQAEDLFLTLEGSGQWAGLQWLMHAEGAAVPEAVALSAFARRSRWWSQIEGVALFLVIDRLAPIPWKKEVFGGGTLTALQLLERALR